MTEDIIADCLLAIPFCGAACCGIDGCDCGCYADCFGGCGEFDACVSDCAWDCSDVYDSCVATCGFDCNECRACDEACDASYCAPPDASDDARLDYILFAGSLDGSVERAQEARAPVSSQFHLLPGLARKPAFAAAGHFCHRPPEPGEWV